MHADTANAISNVHLDNECTFLQIGRSEILWACLYLEFVSFSDLISHGNFKEQ